MEFEKTVNLKEKMRSREKGGAALVKGGLKSKTAARLSSEQVAPPTAETGLASKAAVLEKKKNSLTNGKLKRTGAKAGQLGRGRAKAIDQVYNDQSEVETDLKKINRPKVREVNETWFRRGVLLLALVVVSLVVYGLFFRSDGGQKTSAPTAEQSGRWYMVKLVDGEIFYGQISDTAADPVVIKNVYYDYDQLKGEKKEENPTGSLRLVKRGKETHGPSGEIEIVRTQVLFMEPLREDSKVLKAIREYEK
jgi:hypothetical protein